MRTICFVTYELYPVTRGGCGALLYNVASQLLETGHRVIFLLDLDRQAFDRFDQEERLRLPQPQNCVAYHVNTLLEGTAQLERQDFSSWYEWRSHILAEAAEHVYNAEHPDLIEFFDYHGVAYYSLCRKVTLNRFKNSHVAVRFHATIEAMDRVDLTNYLSPELWTLYSLERGALDLAESVIAPSHSFYERSLSSLYPATKGKERIAVPPLRKALLRHENVKAEPQLVLCYGRLFTIKGVDLLVDAAVLWMQQSPTLTSEFYFVGGDSMQPPDGQGAYADYLKRRIPVELRSRFHFVGHMTHEAMEELLANVRFAVFANRYESFCYAAHELYAAHVPLIVASIPGFADFFEHEKNALVFDETRADSLVLAMSQLWNDAALRERLRFPYPVVPTTVASVYEDKDLPSWITASDEGSRSRPIIVTVMVLAGSLADAKQTLRPLRDMGHTCLALLPAELHPNDISAFLFGHNVVCVAMDGSVLNFHNIRTSEAMLILRSGDVVDARYLSTAATTLGRFEEIAYVTCWQHRLTTSGRSLDTYALSLALDLAPMSGRTPYTRAVFRTPIDQLVLDIFDTNLGQNAELGFLWGLTESNGRGVVIPEGWIRLAAETYEQPSPKQMSYLLNRDGSPTRRLRLAQHTVAHWNVTPASLSDREALDDIRTLPPELMHLLLRIGHKIVHVYQKYTIPRRLMNWTRRRIRAVTMNIPKIR